MSVVQKLMAKNLFTAPKFVATNVQYETIMGSYAYGVSRDTSDVDIYGFCIPPKEMIFPHLAGEIDGFGTKTPRFEQSQQHHIQDSEDVKKHTYDIAMYSIVKYFQLCLQNNPNMIDSLFTPAYCVTHTTKIGTMVRENRHSFLHKGIWHTFKGYAYSQLRKMKGERTGKRKEYLDKYGYDIKFAYHTVRLLGEVEQILVESDLDLQLNREQLKSIRQGDWTEEEVREHFSRKEKLLEQAYHKSSLPAKPPEAKVKQLLLDCLEEHYGNLSNIVYQPDNASKALQDIQDILEKYQRILNQQASDKTTDLIGHKEEIKVPKMPKM